MKTKIRKNGFSFNPLNLFALLIVLSIDFFFITFISHEWSTPYTPKCNFGYEKILLSDENLLSSQEKVWLNDTINENDEVLIVFVDDSLNLSDEEVISSYTQNTCPYVIFRYNFDTNTLTSSQNELVNFESINEGDAKYSDIYTFLPRISSNLKVYPSISVYIISIICLLILLLGTIIVFLIMFKYIGINFRCKKSFFTNSLYIKMPKKNVESIKCIEANHQKNSNTLQISTLFDDKLEDSIIKVTYSNNTVKYLRYVSSGQATAEGCFKKITGEDLDNMIFKYKIS